MNDSCRKNIMEIIDHQLNERKEQNVIKVNRDGVFSQ